MKKLMTMIAAVGMAFGLFAEGTLNNAWKAETTTTIDNWNDDGLWSGATESVEIGTSGEVQTPVIKFKTGSAALSRTVKAGGFTADGNVFFDTYIDLQGQALDELPTVDTSAKIALFALDNTDLVPEGTAPWTGFYALAQYGAAGQALFALGEDTVDIDVITNGLHRITIKAYDNVMSSGTTARPGFVCFIDGVSDTEQAKVLKVTHVYGITEGVVDWSTDLIDTAPSYLGLAATAIDVSAITRFNDKQLLLSLLDGAATFSAVDFIGTASVADITINDTGFAYIPADVQAMQVAHDGITISNVNPAGAVDANGIVLAACSFTVAKDDCDIFKVSGSTAASIDGTTVTISSVIAGDTVTITAAKSVATVTIDETTTPVASLDEAFTAIGSGTGTITLKAAATVNLDLTVNGDVTIDLNGQTITHAGDQYVFNNLGTLTIKDTTGGGQINLSDNGLGIIDNTSGTKVAIEGGKFTGKLFAENAEGTYEITGGAFDKESNSDDSAFAYEDGIPKTGYKCELVSGYWTVTELATPAFSVEAGANSSYKKVMINGVDVIDEIPPTITEGEAYEVTFEPLSGYEFENKAKTKVISGTAGSESVSVIGPAATAILVESITVTAAGGATEVDEKATLQLTAAVLPEDALLREVTWSSSDDTLATVESSGLVMGVKAGNVTITATAKDDSGVTGTINLVVKSVGPTPIDPDQPTEVTADDEEAAKKAVKVKIPTAVADSGVLADQYDGYFTKTAVNQPQGSTTWVVTAKLSETVVKAETETADVAAKLSDIAAAAGETEITIPATDVKPGLFYSLVEGQELGKRQEGKRALATTDGVTLKATHYDGSGFYQIKVSTKAE